ncbi:MAG: ribonuclease P protein component [Dehalococcoidia bacterium]|nr:ribonuclease P protein component [Dehalococcoidia bacterium]
MQRELRLTDSKRFPLIHQEGRVWANRLLVMKIIPNGLDNSRFGFLVGKRIGNAVVRNKVKRRLRDVIRLEPVEAGWDVIFIARRGADSSDYHQLKRAAGGLLKRAKLLSGSHPSAPPNTVMLSGEWLRVSKQRAGDRVASGSGGGEAEA